MASRILSPSFLVALLATGCIETWKGIDDDGDGISVADGDCWDSAEGPPGSSLKGSDIGPGMPDAPYDGIDADCAGNDDYDLDGDGYVTDEAHIGLVTLGITDSGSNHIAEGDCWDDPDLAPDDASHIENRNFINVMGDQVGAADVHPDLDDTWYDGPDQDCGGNNDFDQDEDGDQTSLYADQTGSTGGDCAEGADGEDPRVNLAGLPLDQINSNMDEIWYDGTDQDCQGVEHEGLEVSGLLLDCDQDADGAPVPDIPDSPAGSFCSDEYLSVTRDCNDQDANAVPDPTKEEVPFNGVDDNCAPSLEGTPDGDGDADHDGFWASDYYDRLTDELDPGLDLDGVEFTDCWDVEDDPLIDFPGVDALTFDPAGDPDDVAEWATSFAGDSLTPAQVNPAALDRPYDGVDQDCAGDATPEVEFDWDGDGFLSMYQWYDDGSGNLLSGDDCMDCSDDCADAAADPDANPELTALCEELCDNDDYFIVTGSDVVVNPGGFESTDVNPDASDLYGDGTDQDCQRDIDYDSDGDYYATDPTAAISQGEARAAYYQWSVIGGLYRSDVDCNDDDTNVNPGMTGANDPWYDGVDSDCAGDNDYDQDYDGYVIAAGEGLGTYQDTAKRSAYLVADTDAAPGDDCVDDPSANGTDYNNGQTDTWYDGLDHDCDDNDDYDADADGYASEVQASSYSTTLHDTVAVAGTGSLTTDDCDDTLPLVNPAATEIWYDGDDDDCDEDDDYDADADGFADEDYASSYGPTTNEAGDIAGTGALSTDDCNDADDDFNPDETDSWYDGLDHDCDEADDYDADADGHATDAHRYGTTYHDASMTDAVSGTGSLSADDCNDEEAAINPDETDSWYDGIDHDCDEADDYDADSDGFVPTVYAGLQTYQSETADSDYLLSSTGSLPDDDCVDGPVLGGAYNPGATDTWYDGLDHDCADDDDWDADYDGHADEDYASAYTVTTHAGTTVSGTGSLPVDDCNDTDDAVNPDETDDWYDGIDHDCDGRDDFDADEDGTASDDYTYGSTYQDSSKDSAYIVSGTGSLSDDDCNDTDADVNTGETETWYDNVDSDCAGDDDFDADADGFVPTVYVGEVTYQDSGLDSGYEVAGTGSLPGDDCVDDPSGGSAYNPGATETWYDALDHDCADDDDFDADADGFASETHAGSYATTTHAGASVSGTGSLPTTDCDDGDSATNPDETDTWYDGFDRDCGDNDDFDADGDGSATTGATYATTYYGSSGTAVSGTGSLTADDCNDTDSAVNTSATDSWYDGVDSDCGGDDDFDADTDGFVPTTYVGSATYQDSGLDSAYLVGGSGGLPGDDCVDSDAAYNPGETESWYDGEDYDCADDDDWDADADGHAEESYTASYTTTKQDGAVVSGTGSLPVDDCNDGEDDVSPSDSDTWYDGVDSDCGEDDDFDADGDGQASSDEAGSYGTTYQSYTSTASTWAVSGTGSLATTDCNDAVASVYDGATDTWYDGVDSDCGDDDDYDVDGDGYVLDMYDGDLTTQGAGTGSIGAALPSGDCDDDPTTGAAYSPGVTDSWYDGLDHDCQSDDDYDADIDGYVDDAYVGEDTSVGAVVVYAASASGGECNDAEEDVNPGETDAWYDGVDADCAEDDDYDADDDGYVDDADVGEQTYQSFVSTSSTYLVAGSGGLSGGDCMDEDLTGSYTPSDFYPTASDTWYDGQDTDCADDDDFDADTDGFVEDADSGEVTYVGTTAVSGTGALPDGDCNDTDSAFAPGETDTWYDGDDNDCAGDDDYDADLDGYVDSAYSGLSTYTSTTHALPFAVAGTGTALTHDCDDTDGAINEGAQEICDASDTDEDCDGNADNDDGDAAAATKTTWYPDSDGDSYGENAAGVDYCDDPSTLLGTSHILVDGDCDDDDSSVNPLGTEVCDGGLTDEDCDGFYDDDDVSVTGTSTFYADTDTDGEGDVTSTTDACEAPTGYVADSSDCDDDNGAINTEATEVCDGVDNDCNTDIDDDDAGISYVSATDSWYTDGDTDGYGDENEAEGTYLACDDPSGESGFPTLAVQDNTDCDDSDISINTASTEGATADGIDNDCDDDYDEGLITADSEYVLITEMLIDPSGFTDTNAEWFEIYNPNTFDITIDEDWYFVDGSGSGFALTTELDIPTGTAVVFGRSSDTSLNGNVAVDYAYSAFQLNNSGNDELSAMYFDPEDANTDTEDDSTAVLVDYVGYNNSTWDQNTGYSLQLDNDTTTGYPADGDVPDNEDAAAWCNPTIQWDSGDYGSPGADNEDCSP